jgi:peptidoglycan/xylan/chitin deacetylase (PgdA/CDA1 family)
MYALTLARELQMPMAIYLVSGYIEAKRYFWWDEGRRLVDATQVREVVIEGHKYALEQAAERETLAHVIDHYVRYAHSVTEREQFLHMVSTALDVPLVVEDTQAASLSLSWTQIEEMDKSGYISFGGHTVNHPILAYLDDIKEVQREVTDCRTALEQRLGHAVCSFAYPVGQQQHISEPVVQAVRTAGFDWAMTTSYGFNTPQTDRYRLKRIEVDVDQHWLVMAAETAGLWGFFSRLRWLPFVRRYFTNSR